MPTLTITTTTDQASKIAAAFGAKFDPPRDATAAEIKADIIEYIKDVVQSHRTQQAANAAADAVVQMPDPT